MREVNRRFLVNEQGDLPFFFSFSEFDKRLLESKPITIVEK